MTGIENHAGLTVSGSKLQVVEINYKDEQFILENVDEAYFNEPVNLEKDKETKISALMQGAFNELLIKKPLSSQNVSFTLPFELFYTMQVPYDNTLLHQDLVEEFRWELSVLYPYAPVKDFVIQYIEVDRNSINEQNTAIVIALPRKYLQLIYNFCEENKLRLKFVDNSHFASERALAVSNPLAGKGLNLSVYLCNKYLSVIFSLNGKPVYFKIIPVADAGEIPSILLSEVSPHEGFTMNRNIIDTAFISGEDVSLPLVDSLRDALELDLINFNPFDKIKPEQRLFSNKCYSERFNSFAPAAGIAYRLA
jgi:Tfp pilus assembly PilM family ATPase